MEPQTVQTAFRFRPDLLRRLKNKARYEKKSLNAYVEEVLESSLAESDEDRLDVLFNNMANRGRKISPATADHPVIVGLTRNPLPHLLRSITFTEDELKDDDRLAYLLGK